MSLISLFYLKMLATLLCVAIWLIHPFVIEDRWFQPRYTPTQRAVVKLIFSVGVGILLGCFMGGIWR